MKEEGIRRIGFLMSQISRFIKFAYSKKLLESNLEMTFEQATVIMILFHYNGINQQEIANRAFKDKSTILRTIDSLEEKGLVTRVKDEKDRRNNLIFISKEGKIIQNELLTLHFKILKEFLEDIEEEDYNEMDRILTLLFTKTAKFYSINNEQDYNQRKYDD